MDPEENEEVSGQGEETGEIEETVAQESGGGDSINPAWNDLLSKVPSQLHSQVTPYLSQWDKNYQEGLQKVHSEYEPYKKFTEHQPEELDYALSIMKAIEENPQEVAKALAEYSGLSLAEAKEVVKEQGQFDETEENELLNHPQFVEMKSMVEAMAQLLVQQNQAKLDAEMDAQLETELKELSKEHGEFDVDWVLTKALAKPEVDLAEHVKAYREHEKSVLEKARKPGPKVLKGGGSAPDNQTDITKLDDKGRRELIAKTLQQAAQQSQ